MLTLIVPGLIWPRQALADLTYDMNFPALSLMLGRGQLRRLPAQDSHNCVAHALNLPTPLPVAALRRRALDRAIGDHSWLCLDPIHLRFEQQTPIMDDPAQLQLSDDEAHALLADLTPAFAEFGDLELLTTTRWSLRLKAPCPDFEPLSHFVLRGGPALPRTPAFAAWRKAMSEAEIVLHQHPVNRARETAGQPVINGVWPWGGGLFPTVPASSAPRAFDVFLSDDPVVQGLARWLDLPCMPLPTAYSTEIRPRSLAIFDKLEPPARKGDGHEWRTQIQGLETDWLAPLIKAIRSGKLAGLRLLAPDRHGLVELQVQFRDLWKVWKKPASLIEAFGV